MDALHFAYWLRGYTEVTNGAYPTLVQWQIIQDHLNEVFVKVTPDRYTSMSGQTLSAPMMRLDDRLSTTGCGVKQLDPTLPRPDTDIAYCGARLRTVWPVPAGDGSAIQNHSTTHTC